MAIQGFTRARKHQFGRQSAVGTNVPATKAYGFKGVPSVDLKWTDPDVDTGSIDVTANPAREAPDLSASLTDPRLTYNSLPLALSAIFGGAVTATGSGTAKTWVHAPAAVAPLDGVDVHTYQFGDDVADDWYQLGDGLLESYEVSGPEGLGALTAAMAWRFGSVRSTGSTDSPVTVGPVPTADLDVDTNEAIVYLKDGAIFIASDPDYLAANKITDALHTFKLSLKQAYDLKRWANGDQSFDIDAYGRGARAIELEVTFAKTEDTVGTGSESDAWFSDEPVTRYVRFVFTSKVLAQSPSTFYGWTVTMPLRYYTRTEGEVGGNTTVVLTGHAFYDPDIFEGVFESTAVTTQAAL
jgi:hypothetical protein